MHSCTYSLVSAKTATACAPMWPELCRMRAGWKQGRHVRQQIPVKVRGHSVPSCLYRLADQKLVCSGAKGDALVQVEKLGHGQAGV